MYKIIGADGREYGPVTAEQLRRWIVEGRANAQTRIQRQGAVEWQPLGSFIEFAGSFSPAVPPGFPPLVTGPIRKTSGYATAGLICGVVSCTFCCCYGMPLNLAGIILSAIALARIHRHPEIYEGRALAISGLVISAASFVVYIILLIIGLANGNFHFDWNNQFSP